MCLVQYETSKRFEVSTDNEINFHGKRKFYIYLKSFVKWAGIYLEKDVKRWFGVRYDQMLRRDTRGSLLAKQVIGRVVVVVRFYFGDVLKCVSAACYDKLTIR